MKNVGVVTVARSDYAIYLPVLRMIAAHPRLNLLLFVSGAHLSSEFGLTVKEIEADGFDIHERVEMLLSSDTPEGIAKSMGLGTLTFGQAFARCRPDVLLVLGDRFEMHAAALAALPFKIPVAHIHGGEITEGAIDNSLRHSLTKISHLHFVANQQYARRIIQMGEEPWRVIVSGAPGLDNLRSTKLLNPRELAAKYGLRLERPPLLVTFHPVTLEYEQTEAQVSEMLVALASFELPVVFTAPNADTNGRVVTRMIEEFIRKRPSACLVLNFGTEGYFSMMAFAAAMVGNSSSGIIEAPSFGLPVVNIGTRQQGRIRAKNVLDVGYGRDEIIGGIRKAISPEFRASLQGIANPYGSGRASEVIVRHLEEIDLDDRLLVKRFVDISGSLGEERGAGVAS
ncbi:MAG: UDP-N-acetylglucosamine 2-epimerase (hydrolyzing) [Candidatus Omnitrophica bacterium]|nr:UDP-N-acetylglucosamine 2-epimerase (hydrolyzing) [Candidatus Omnitrophota bacterium]